MYPVARRDKAAWSNILHILYAFPVHYNLTDNKVITIISLEIKDDFSIILIISAEN
jgi:hypothetical protein